MVTKNIIKLIALIELFIGLSTIFGLMISAVLGVSAKPRNVFFFVGPLFLLEAQLGADLLNEPGT